MRRVRVERRRDRAGDLLPGWHIRWTSGTRCEHPTHAEALACIDAALRS